MTRKRTIAVILAILMIHLLGGSLEARGGRGGGGGARGGGGGFRGGGGGGFRGGGGASFARAPSFSAPRSFERPANFGGAGMANRGFAGGMNGGQFARPESFNAGRAVGFNPGAGAMAGRGEVGERGIGGNQFGGVNNRNVNEFNRNNIQVNRNNIGVAGRPIGAGGYGGGFGASQFRPYGYNAYGGYHNNWVHGYWNGHDNAAWGWRSPYWGYGGLGYGYGSGLGLGLGLGLGAGLGWGLASWGYGSSLYGMGYMPYSNPYYGAGIGFASQPGLTSPYDYSQPIDTTSPPVVQAVADPAMSLFDIARTSFQQGDYAGALKQVDNALTSVPNDTSLHEFRALCLFALARYDDAAGTLYDVLSVGPGWDWTTMIGLYPSVDVYTKQLRALEDYCRANPRSASARFVLAYHYLTQGHTDTAVGIFKEILAINPADRLSQQLLRQLDPSTDKPAASAPTASPADTTPPPGASIFGTWTAKPAADTSITLTIQPGGAFNWQVARNGQNPQFAGTSTFDNGILTLAQDKGPAMVGRVSWKDPNHMTFRIVGDGPDDPGLSFSK